MCVWEGEGGGGGVDDSEDSEVHSSCLQTMQAPHVIIRGSLWLV